MNTMEQRKRLALQARLRELKAAKGHDAYMEAATAVLGRSPYGKFERPVTNARIKAIIHLLELPEPTDRKS